MIMIKIFFYRYIPAVNSNENNCTKNNRKELNIIFSQPTVNTNPRAKMLNFTYYYRKFLSVLYLLM